MEIIHKYYRFNIRTSDQEPKRSQKLNKHQQNRKISFEQPES